MKENEDKLKAEVIESNDDLEDESKVEAKIVEGNNEIVANEVHIESEKDIPEVDNKNTNLESIVEEKTSFEKKSEIENKANDKTQEVNKIDNQKETPKNDSKVEDKKVNKKEKKITENKYNSYEYINKQKRKKRAFVITGIVSVFIVLLIALFCIIFALINSNNNTILGGISIRNVLVEGLTRDEAINVIDKAVNSEKMKEIVLKVNGEIYTITQEQIEIKYDVEDAVERAYAIGRSGNIFQNNFAILGTMLEENNIDIELTFNEELLDKILNEIEVKLPNALVDNTYDVEEDELIITRGVDGLVIDKNAAKEAIIKSIKEMNNEPIELKTINAKCPEIDIEKIYGEVKTEPQDATYTTNPFSIVPHKTGLDFDLEEAKELLKEAKDEYVIELQIIEPKIHTNEIGEEAFPDLLSSFSTKYDASNLSRSNNLMLAMEKINGTVVMPGEVFSYNKTVGKRTVEAGYQNANGFAGGGVVPMLGGGICQISSTLYDAILYANLNVVERHNHMYQATYVEPGKDATVVYGSLDFKFENTRKNPILIKTKCGSGLAEIKIFGIKEEVEYEIEIISEVYQYTPYKVVYQDDTSLAPGVEKVSQYGLQGCKSTTYRIRKLNGQEVSKEVLSTDVYDPLNKIVRRGVQTTSTTATTQEAQTETPVLSAETPVETPVTQEETTPQTQETPAETPSVPAGPETPSETPEQQSDNND